METDIHVIATERLLLWPMTAAFLEASLAGDIAAAEAGLGARIESDWFAERELMQMRRGDLHDDPAARPWLLRAVVERATQQMVGHAGFHTPPNPRYLRELGLDGVEFGYTIYPPFRRRGYARETALGLMHWAHEQHGIRSFIASVSPDNLPSVELIEQLGFRRVAAHVDDVDGYEDIYQRMVSPS